MTPQGPNVAKSRLDGTLLLNQNQRVEPNFGYSSRIQPVSIVDCAPNTGFLPVLKDYAAEYIFAVQTNGIATDGPSLTAPADGIYDLEFFVGTGTFSSGIERFQFMVRDAALNELVMRRVSVLGDGSTAPSWKIAVYALQGWEFKVQAVAAFTGEVMWGLSAIPRSL